MKTAKLLDYLDYWQGGEKMSGLVVGVGIYQAQELVPQVVPDHEHYVIRLWAPLGDLVLFFHSREDAVVWCRHLYEIAMGEEEA